jgi:predicted metal-dependent phosphoesterase TrpH
VRVPFAIDLHVHTRAHSECAELMPPEALPDAVRARGLSGVVIAEHDAMWSAEEMAAVASALGPDRRVYSGIEVTSAEGHIVVIGLRGMSGVEKGMTVAKLAQLAARDGAALILAHPHRDRPSPYEVVPPGLHAIEVCSSSTHGEATSRALALAESHGLHRVAGSDAHAPRSVGSCYTLFHALPASASELALMIRAGLGRPFPCGGGGGLR